MSYMTQAYPIMRGKDRWSVATCWRSFPASASLSHQPLMLLALHVEKSNYYRVALSSDTFPDCSHVSCDVSPDLLTTRLPLNTHEHVWGYIQDIRSQLGNTPSCPVAFTFTVANPRCVHYIMRSYVKYCAYFCVSVREHICTVVCVCVCVCVCMFELLPRLSRAASAVARHSCG